MWKAVFATAAISGVLLWMLFTPNAANAAPPSIGLEHSFFDPYFGSTVMCDTREQVESIALSDTPKVVYRSYMQTPNEVNEPTCLAVYPQGTVLNVHPIGVMHDHGKSFNAWAVQIHLETTTAWVLYLEEFREVAA
jgi:hypothetical protein